MAGLVTAAAIASQGYTWKALDGARAAFHLKWLLAVWALQSSSRPAWSKPFFSPPLGPGWVVSFWMQYLFWPWNLWQSWLSTCHMSCDSEMAFWTSRAVHFRCLGLFFVLTFTSHLLLSLALIWLLSYRVHFLFLTPENWYNFSGFLFGSSLHSLPVCQLLILSNYPALIHCQPFPQWELRMLNCTYNSLFRISILIIHYLIIIIKILDLEGEGHGLRDGWVVNLKDTGSLKTLWSRAYKNQPRAFPHWTDFTWIINCYCVKATVILGFSMTHRWN